MGSMNNHSTQSMKQNNSGFDVDNPLVLLQWYLASGVDECIGEVEVDRFALTEKVTAPSERKASDSGQSAPAPTQKSPSPQMVSNEQLIREAENQAENCTSLAELKTALTKFEGCSIKKTASNTVFSSGNAQSHIMVIGDAPSVEDDRSGDAFCGPDGLLLDKMFGAIDLSREKDIYLSHLLPWRPPGNRKPTESEMAVCLPFLRRHIELFQPDLIILLGGLPANALLKEDQTIARLRGKWKTIEIKGNAIPVVSLYHPAYLRRQPQGKADAWKDLLSIKAHLEGEK